MQQFLAGTDVPIPIVGKPTSPATTCNSSSYTDGCFKGWAMFHVISASGGSSKNIRGYFTGEFQSSKLSVGACTAAQQAANSCGVIDTSVFGAYDVRLTN